MALYDPYGHLVRPSTSHHGDSQRTHEKENADAPDNPTENLNSKPVPAAVPFNQAIAAQDEQRHSYDEKHYRFQKLGLWIQFALCVFSACAFGAAAYYAHVTNLQPGIMQRQLEATDRPWIQITSVNLTDGLSFYRTVDAHGAVANFKVVAKNVGRSVAVHVKMTGHLIFARPDEMGSVLVNRERALCSAADPLHTTSEFTLFPDESSGARLSGQSGCGGSELIPPDAFWPALGPPFVLPVYAGCISYQAAGSSRSHHTGFLYEFDRRWPNGAVAHQLFRLGERYTTDQIALMEDVFGFSDVN